LELANFILREEDGAVASIFFIFLCPWDRGFFRVRSGGHILTDRWPSTAACPCSLLGDGVKGIEIIEILYCVKKYFVLSRCSQGWTKISCTGTTSPT
jgi:hypothetical protein